MNGRAPKRRGPGDETNDETDMAAPTLAKRLVKELQRGGKKTVVLGLLLLGGLYFWLPMLWKAVAPKPADPAQSAATSAPAMATNDVDPDEDAAPPSAVATVEWKSLIRRLENVPLLEPVALDELVRDPFDLGWIREKQAPPPTVTTEPAAPAVADPLTAMALSGVLVSSSGGAAIINSRVYRIGDEIPRDGPVRYVLKHILPDKVVLEREGNSFEMKVARKQADRIEQ